MLDEAVRRGRERALRRLERKRRVVFWQNVNQKIFVNNAQNVRGN